MSATAEQFVGALGIAVFYLISHSTYVDRLHTLVEESPLAALTDEQYAGLRDHLRRQNKPGSTPRRSTQRCVTISHSPSMHRHADAFTCGVRRAAIISIIGVVACALLVRRDGRSEVDMTSGRAVFGTAAAVGSAAVGSTAPGSPRTQVTDRTPEQPA